MNKLVITINNVNKLLTSLLPYVSQLVKFCINGEILMKLVSEFSENEIGYNIDSKVPSILNFILSYFDNT